MDITGTNWQQIVEYGIERFPSDVQDWVLTRSLSPDELLITVTQPMASMNTEGVVYEHGAITHNLWLKLHEMEATGFPGLLGGSFPDGISTRQQIIFFFGAQQHVLLGIKPERRCSYLFLERLKATDLIEAVQDQILLILHLHNVVEYLAPAPDDPNNGSVQIWFFAGDDSPRVPVFIPMTEDPRVQQYRDEMLAADEDFTDLELLFALSRFGDYLGK